MNRMYNGPVATLMALGFALMLAGCPSKPQCKTDSDCTGTQVCDTTTNKCVAPTDKCKTVTCPGAQTCDSSTGQCTGTCCTTGACPNPTTSCDETACAAGNNPCVAKACSPACGTGFTCNAAADPPVCVADCLTTGCLDSSGNPVPNETCNATSGACELVLPGTGDVGSPCTTGTDCKSGKCLTPSQVPPNGYCTADCQADADCPSGSTCAPSVQMCFDACDPTIGDCTQGQQCVNIDQAFGGTGSELGCFPFFGVSTCTTGCAQNGASCTTDNDCAAGSSCIQYGGGLDVCMKTSCQAFGNGCGSNQTCEGIGLGLTACFNNCDATDPSACAGLAAAGTPPITCQLSPQIESNYDGYWLTDSASNCNQGEQSQTVTISGQTVAVCYSACTADADCGPGQFCGDNGVQFNSGDSLSFKTCMNYNVTAGACSGGQCGSHDCLDLTSGSTAIGICYDKCTQDSDCTAGFGGSCQRLAFQSGDAIDVCLYQNAGSICFAGCANNSDCGYCQTNADCPTNSFGSGVTRQLKCDSATNMCVVPIQSVVEANSFCRTGQTWNPTAINQPDGSTLGGCATPCNDDLDCSGSCVANAQAPQGFTGFCGLTTQLCNGPTGQCENTCTGSTDCIHGQCAFGDGPGGENRCVLSCGSPSDNCGSGMCDTNASYCVDDCTVSGCSTGFSCDTTSGLCAADPTIDTLTVGGMDALTNDVVSFPSGTVDWVWATSNAASISVMSAPLPSTGGCTAVTATAWTAVAGFPTTASSTYSMQMLSNMCFELIAQNSATQVTRVFEADDLPNITTFTADAGTLGITVATGGSVTITIDTIGSLTDDVVANYQDSTGAGVGTADQAVCSKTVVDDGTTQTATCSHTILPTDIPATATQIVYTVTCTDTEGDLSTTTATVPIQ